MPATGGVVPTYVMRPVKLLRYVSTFDYFILVCEIAFGAFILYYFVEEAIEVIIKTKFLKLNTQAYINFKISRLKNTD